MDLEAAKELLNKCVRQELRDHSFGDVEVFWMLDGKEIASGYFGGGDAGLSFEEIEGAHFQGTDALELRDCGNIGHVERNDETGPDTFSLGYTMPGLTLEGVRKELTTPPEAGSHQ